MIGALPRPSLRSERRCRRFGTSGRAPQWMQELRPPAVSMTVGVRLYMVLSDMNACLRLVRVHDRSPFTRSFSDARLSPGHHCFPAKVERGPAPRHRSSFLVCVGAPGFYAIAVVPASQAVQVIRSVRAAHLGGSGKMGSAIRGSLLRLCDLRDTTNRGRVLIGRSSCSSQCLL